MTDIYKRRYINALKKASKINRYLKKWYNVFYDGSPIQHGFFMRDNWLLLKYDDVSSTIYFCNDK